MKILIIGHGRHGKDTVAEMLDLPFQSSSEAACVEVIYKHWGHEFYSDATECFDDRINHREKWFELISEFNSKDPTRLAKKILENNDIYVGLRSRREFLQAKKEKLFDVVVWVDASKRLPPESSNELTIHDADIVLNNNGTEHDLLDAVMVLKTMLNGKMDAGHLTETFHPL